MRPSAQTILSGRLTVSQMARVGEIECLIIIICRQFSTNLENNDTIIVCEYLLSGHGAPSTGTCNCCRLADLSPAHSSQVVSTLNAMTSISGIWIQMVGQVSHWVQWEREPWAYWGIEGFWDCLLLGCNWINLASNLFRSVTLLHPREPNLRCFDWVYAQVKLIILLFFFFSCCNSTWAKCVRFLWELRCRKNWDLLHISAF